MNSPASMRTSNASWRAASSAERTGLGASSRSFPIVSIACVYMPGAFRCLFPALVDDAPCLADEGALERVGQADADRRRDAHHGLDAMAQPRRDLVAILLGVRRQHLAA